MEMKKVKELMSTIVIQEGVKTNLNSVFQGVNLNKYLETMVNNHIKRMIFTYDNNPYELYYNICGSEALNEYNVNIGVFNVDKPTEKHIVHVVFDGKLNIQFANYQINVLKEIIEKDEIKNAIRDKLNPCIKDINLYSYIKAMIDNNTGYMFFEYDGNVYELYCKYDIRMNCKGYTCDFEIIGKDNNIHSMLVALFDTNLTCEDLFVQDLK